MVQAVRHRAHWRTPSCAASEGSDTTGRLSSPSGRSSARPLQAASLLPGPPPDLETVFNDQVRGGHQGGRSPHRAPATQPPAPCAGGGVPLGAPELDPGRSQESRRPPGLRLRRLARSSDARPVPGTLQTSYPRRVLQEVKAALPPAARAYLNRVLLKGTLRPPSAPGPLDFLIGPLPRRSNRPPHPFTASQLHELQPVRFQTTPRKHLYMLALHTLHALTLVSHPDTKWRDLLPPLEGEQPRWASLYSTLVPRPVGDISWRLLHGAVSTGTYLARFTPIPDTCPFCGVRGNTGACIFGVR
ncbi:unnamed protein product [Natator depressus]